MKETAFNMQEFVSIVSHDFRAPIRHLCQFSNILSESLSTPTEEQEQCVEFIKNSTEQCNKMMDALTQLSQVHTQAIHAVPTDFDALLRLTCAELAVRDHCQPILNITNSVAERPSMDAWHAKTLVQALTDNAFKFRNQNKDLVLQLDISNDNGQQVIKISDNGIGISPHFIDHCTIIFKQLDTSVEGVGLGLTLVENIVFLYQGSLTVESEIDGSQGGTTVTIVLPLKR
ncbi:MAG: sensor histidine kinase [Pseudomonadales bacterium]